MKVFASNRGGVVRGVGLVLGELEVLVGGGVDGDLGLPSDTTRSGLVGEEFAKKSRSENCESVNGLSRDFVNPVVFLFARTFGCGEGTSEVHDAQLGLRLNDGDSVKAVQTQNFVLAWRL